MGDWDRFCDSYGLDFYADPTIFSEKDSYNSRKGSAIKFEPRSNFLFLSFQDALSFLRKNRKDKHGVPRIIRRLNIDINKNHDFFICLSIRESYDYHGGDEEYLEFIESIPELIYDPFNYNYIESAIPSNRYEKYGISTLEKKFQMFSSQVFLKSDIRDYEEFKNYEIKCRKKEHDLEKQFTLLLQESRKPRRLDNGSLLTGSFHIINWEKHYDQIYNEARNNKFNVELL